MVVAVLAAEEEAQENPIKTTQTAHNRPRQAVAEAAAASCVVLRVSFSPFQNISSFAITRLLIMKFTYLVPALTPPPPPYKFFAIHLPRGVKPTTR